MDVPVTFSKANLHAMYFSHTDALVIAANIYSSDVRHKLVDNGSSVDLLFADTFDKMGLTRSHLQATGTPLRGFSRGEIEALGRIDLPVTFGLESIARTETITFDVVDIPYQYNSNFGWGLLNKFLAIPHGAYLCIKMPGPEGIITIASDQELARQVELDTAPDLRRWMTPLRWKPPHPGGPHKRN